MIRKSIVIAGIALVMSGCAAVQSIVRSTFPYTANLLVASSGKPGTTLSVSSPASSFDQIFTGQGSNTSAIRDVRIASSRLDASSPSGQSMGVFKSIKIFISRGDSSAEVLVASRDDIGANIGSSIMLDIDNSKVLDDYIKGSTLRVRMEYVLRSDISQDITLKSSLGFSASPDTKK